MTDQTAKMDFQLNSAPLLSNQNERNFHCGSACTRKKPSSSKRKCSISSTESLILVTILTLVLMTQLEGAYAKKPKKIQKWKQNCKIRTSQWEECSKPCDMGVSFRVVTTTLKCKLKRESRLCFVRHCDEARFRPPIKVICLF